MRKGCSFFLYLYKPKLYVHNLNTNLDQTAVKTEIGNRLKWNKDKERQYYSLIEESLTDFNRFQYNDPESIYNVMARIIRECGKS